MQTWRGGAIHRSGRDVIEPLALQRDCMVPMPYFQAFQLFLPHALAHSQLILTGCSRAQDATPELELSCDPFSRQLEVADQHVRWIAAMKRGRRCRREEAEIDDHIIETAVRAVACHWCTSGALLVLEASKMLLLL